MKEINRLAAQAKRALDRLQNGKTYTSAYVSNRLDTAAAINSKDQLICNMRDVIKKKASGQKFITQKEIASIYDHLYGFSSGRSNFREQLGDLLPAKHATLNFSEVGASESRIPMENKLDNIYEDTDLSRQLSGAFSLDKKALFSAHSDNTISKAEKFAKVQLSSMGWNPLTVKGIRSNEHFVLCNATLDTSDHTQISVPIPVQVTNGIPSLPQHFVAGDELLKLNSENLFLFIKDKNNHMKKTANRKFAAQRDISEIHIDRVVTPVALEKYADLEDSLVSAATHFSKDQVLAATNTVALEISSLGVSNPQVKVLSSSPNQIVVSASIPTGMGRVDIKVPVDMPNGSPALPRHFEVSGKSLKLSRASINQVVNIANNNKSVNKISREQEAMGRLSYAQLIDSITEGVSYGDYKKAEDALGAIGSKFGPAKHSHALEYFSKLLKHSGKSSDRDSLIKNALRTGELIWVQTSVEPYCPKLGLPVSKVDFDSKGRVVPMSRKAQASNIDETGALISSSRVQLT